MEDTPVYFLDAVTDDLEYRLTCFTDSITGAVESLFRWIRVNDIPGGSLWYADMFMVEDGKHFCSVSYNEQGEYEIIPAPQNSRLTPFQHHYRLHRIRYNWRQLWTQRRNVHPSA